MSTNLRRRTFIKAGLLGAAALAAAGGLYRLTKSTPATNKFVLSGEAKSALEVIVVVMLKDAIPSSPQAVELHIGSVQAAIAGLPFATQKEIEDLFGLLTLAPTRRFVAGIAGEWAEAKPEEVATFLQSWRTHRFPMLQSAYHALHDLIIGPWYANESTWESIGYPGPTKELS